jgi:hypothetical protein
MAKPIVMGKYQVIWIIMGELEYTIPNNTGLGFRVFFQEPGC